MNKKIIILLLFLAIIMSGCIQKPVKPNNEQPENNNVVQKNDEKKSTSTEEVDTSDWLTYRNEEYGFEFKYKKDWIIKNNLSNEGGYLYVTTKEREMEIKEKKLTNERNYFFIIKVDNNFLDTNNVKSLKEWVEQNENENIDIFKRIQNVGSAEIGGKSGYVIAFFGGMTDDLSSYFENNSKIFIIDESSNKYGSENVKYIYNSFKFLD